MRDSEVAGLVRLEGNDIQPFVCYSNTGGTLALLFMPVQVGRSSQDRHRNQIAQPISFHELRLPSYILRPHLQTYHTRLPLLSPVPPPRTCGIGCLIPSLLFFAQAVPPLRPLNLPPFLLFCSHIPIVITMIIPPTREIVLVAACKLLMVQTLRPPPRVLVLAQGVGHSLLSCTISLSTLFNGQVVVSFSHICPVLLSSLLIAHLLTPGLAAWNTLLCMLLIT